MAWPPVGFAGVAAPAAHAANLGVLVSCPFMEQAYATQNVATPGQYRRERTGWCVINDARRHVGAPPLLNQSERQASSLGDAQRAVALRWWCLTDGLVSHVDPSQSGMTPSAAIAQRIANAGLGPNGTPDTHENTFSSWGDGGGFPLTILGAVRWWLHDPPHRATLVSSEYSGSGSPPCPAARSLRTRGAQAGTFVADFGSCSGT